MLIAPAIARPWLRDRVGTRRSLWRWPWARITYRHVSIHGKPQRDEQYLKPEMEAHAQLLSSFGGASLPPPPVQLYQTFSLARPTALD